MQINFKRSVLLLSCLLAISCSSKVQTSFQCQPDEYRKDLVNAPQSGDKVLIRIGNSATAGWPDLEQPNQQLQEVNKNQMITWNFGRLSTECRTSRKCRIEFTKENFNKELLRNKALNCWTENADYFCAVNSNELFRKCKKEDQICAFHYTIFVGDSYRDPVIIVRPPQ